MMTKPCLCGVPVTMHGQRETWTDQMLVHVREHHRGVVVPQPSFPVPDARMPRRMTVDDAESWQPVKRAA
jgi:hypothetical protein